ACFPCDLIEPAQHESDLRFSGQAAPGDGRMPVRIIAALQNTRSLIQSHQRSYSGYYGSNVFLAAQQLACAKQTFQNIANRMQELPFSGRKCVSFEPSILVVLFEYPVAILDSRADESLFIEFAPRESQTPCCAGVVALNGAGRHFRKMFTPGSVFILNGYE